MAAIELLVEVRQAKEAVQSIDKRFENLDKSIDKVGDTFSRLEKSMNRIAASINKIVAPINKLNTSLLSLTRATGAYGKQIQLIEKANKRLSKQLDKAKKDLKNTAEELSRKARSANKANKELEKLNNQLIKSGRKMNIFGFEVGGVNRALNQMNIKIKASEYMFSILAQAALTFVAQNVVGYLIRMTDQFKLMESRLRIVNSNITTLNTNLGSTVAVALATRQSLFAVGNLMARIGRNSLELKKNTLELASATSTISKAFQIAGATAEEARNAIVQLSQALASGRLQGDELRSILELAPTLAESISKSIGITVGQLRSFAREGLITTEVMLASISQSTKEINEAFAKIRPTVSQAMTNVQTSVQALLGFQNTFREANDALARSFLSLAGFIRDFSKNEAKLDPLARVLKTLAENIIAIGAAAVEVTLYFGAYLLIVKSVTSAMKAAAAATAAFNAATAMSPIGRIGKAISAVVGYLAKLAAGIFIVNKGFETFGAVNENVGLMASSIKDVNQVLKEVEDGIKKTNKEAAEFAEKMGTVAKVLTPEEETTRRWAALTEAVNYTREAVKQLDDKIKDQKRSLKEFEGSAKETYRNIAAGIETGAIAIARSIGAIFVAIKNLIEMSASGFTLLGQYIQLPFDAAMSKLGISEKAYQSRLKSIETHTKSFVDSLNEMKGAFTGIIPTEDELSITNSILGKSAEARKKEIKELEKAKSDAENKLADLETELIENSIKKQKNAQELILAQIKAQTEAAINQYRLEARLARESFDLAFREPFNIRFQSTQSSLDQFAAGFQQDFNKTLQGLVPDAAFDITDFIFKDKGESPFIAKNFLDRVRGLKKEVSQLTADDIIPIFGLGSKSKSGGFPYESEFVARLMEMSEPLKKSIQKLREEKVDPLLPKQLAAKAVELVEKYSSGVLQTLLTIEAQLVKQLKTSVQTAKQDKETLRLQLASVSAARSYTKTRLSGLVKENIQISKQAALQQNFERMRLNSIGITNDEIDKGSTKVGEQAKIFLDMIVSNAEITKQIKEQTLLNEINNELVSSDKRLSSLKLELKEIEKGSSEFEIQKKQREALHEEENKVIKALRENEGVSTEIVDLYQQMVNKKFELLNTEQQITEQIREQQNLQKSEEQLAEARLMKQAEKLGADRFAESGFFNRIFVEAGGKADLDLRMTKDIQDIIKARIESGVSALDIKLTKTGEVLIDEDYFKTLDPKIKEIREQNFNVILEKLRLDRTEVVRKNILNNRVDPNVIEYTGGSKGGYLRGAPHSSGGIKGFLYGQPIELEGGEFVISKAAVEKYGVSIFEALNSRKFKDGGVVKKFRVGSLAELDNPTLPIHQMKGPAGGHRFPGVVKTFKQGLAPMAPFTSRSANINEPIPVVVENANKISQEIAKPIKIITSKKEKLPGTEITIEKAYELANKLSARGMTAESNKFRSAIASFYDQKGIPTFTADGGVIGDRRAVTRSGREKVLREREEAALEASSKARYEEIESVTKLTSVQAAAENLETEKISNTAKAIRVMNESTEAVSSFRKQIQVDSNTTPKNLGFAGSSMSQETIDSLDNAMKAPIGFWEDFTDKTIEVFAGAAGQAPGGMSGIADIASIFSSTAEPISGSIKILTKRLAQNERFQKSLERFFEMFYTIFDEVAEGLAFIFEALVDFVEPLKPILQMVGSSLREVLKAFTQIIRPFSILLEALQPVLVYLTGFLQIAVSVIATIFNFFGQGLTSIFEGIVESFGMDVGDDYKSLNLLKQERDILGEINSSISGLADTLKDIQDVMFDIQTSALNIAAPGVKLEIAAEKYDELLRAAEAPGASTDAVDAFLAFTKSFLQQAQDVLKTSNSYNQLYLKVDEDLQRIQKNAADAAGKLATKEIQKAVFNLGLAGSSLGDDIVQVVDSVKAGIIGYDDFIQYVGYKLAQTGQDIDLKEFAEFGNITGKSLDALVTSFYAFRDDEFDRIAKGLEGASNASTVADDFKTLFGIDTLGNKIQGTTPLIISELVEAVDTYGRDSAQVRKILDRQPTLGDIRDPGDVSQDPSKDGMSFDFTKLTGPDLLGPLLVAVQELFTNAVKAVQEAWGLIETNVNGLISEIDRVYKEALELLETNLEGIISELEKGFKKVKENVESLGEIDLGNALQVNLESLKSQLDNLGIDLTDVDLANALQVNLDTIKAELDGIDFDLSGVDLATEFENALGELKISGLDIHLGQQIQGVIDNAIGEAEVLFDKLKMLKNPFYPAIGEDYLIEFEKGGLLRGPSHSQGGIKAVVGGGRMVELEGGEYIINKRATSNIGLGFLNFINNVGRKNISEKDFYNSSGMRKFENGGYPVNVGDAFNTDRLSYNVEDFFVSLDSLVENTANSLSVGVSGFGGSLKNKNPNAPSARKGPKSIERLFEPQNKIGNAQIIDIGLETNGVLKDIFGSHGFNLDIDFPGGANGEIFNTGGYVRQYYHSNTPNNLMPSGRMDSDAKEVKRRNKFEIPAYADERRGILNETANHPDRLGIGIKQSGNFTEGMLPGGVFSSISSAINNVLDEGLRFLTETVQLIAFFGGDLTRNYTKFSPFAGLDGSGKAKEEFNNPLEYIALLVTMVSAASWMYENFGGNKGGFGLTTVNDWLTPIGLGFGKDDAFGEMPIAPLAFLSYIPMLDSTNPILNLFGLRSDVEDKYGKKQFSILDALNIGFHTGYKNLSGLNDLQKFLLLYASYEVGNAAFGLDLFSPLDSLFNLFGGGRSSSSRGESSALSRMPSFLGGSSRSSSRRSSSGSSYVNAVPSFLGGSSRSSSGRSSYSGGSRGERSAIARMPDFLEQGGLAVGPSHDSGMLGLAGGKPFLFEGGEYIVNKNAVDKIGVNTLNKINQGNLPKFEDGGFLGGLDFGKVGEFFDFSSEDGWGTVFKGLMIGLGAAASYGIYQLLQGTDADADYIDRDYAKDLKNVADYTKELVENPKKIVSTAVGTAEMAFGAVAGAVDTMSKNYSDFESKGLINTLEHLASIDYLDPESYLGSPGEILGAAVGEAMRQHYKRHIGKAKPYDPLTKEKLKYAGMKDSTADNLRYTLTDWSPVDTIIGDVVLGGAQFISDILLQRGGGSDKHTSELDVIARTIDAGHPVMFVTDNLVNVRTSSKFFRNALKSDLMKPSKFEDPGEFTFNGNAGPYNIWETMGWFAAHEGYHYQQYQDIGGGAMGSRERFKNFWTHYIDNFALTESQNNEEFAFPYSSMFGDIAYGGFPLPRKPALNMPSSLATKGGTEYYYPIQMFGKSFDERYLERNFDTNWFNDTHPEFGYYDYFRPPTTAVNPQAPTSNYPEFGSGGSLMSGGVASGPSHQSGIMGFAEGGGPFLFEGGEYIINKDATKALGIDFLDSLNTGGVIPQAGLGDPLQQLLISQRQAPQYMYGTMSAQDMRMQAANLLLPMAFTGELGLFSSDLSRSFGNRGKLSSGLFGAAVGLLYGGLLGALVGNKGRDNVALSLLFSGIGSYSGVSQNRPENYPSGRKLFDFASGGSIPSYQIGGIFPDIEAGSTTYKTDSILAALLGLGGIGFGISYLLDAFSSSKTTSSRTNVDNVFDRLPEFLGGPATRVSTTTSPSSGSFDGLLAILAFLGGSKLLYDSLGKYTDKMIEENNKSGSTPSGPNDFAPHPDTFDYGALTRFYNKFVPDSGHKVDKSFLHSIGHFSYSNEKGPYLFTGVSFGSYLDNIRHYDPYDMGVIGFNSKSGVDANLINDFYSGINQKGVALGNKILVEDTPSASDLSIGYTGDRSLIEPYSKLIVGTDTRRTFNSSIGGVIGGSHSTPANYYSNSYNALKYLPFIGMMSESDPNFMLTGNEKTNYDYHINRMSNIAEMFNSEDDPLRLNNNKEHSRLHDIYFSGPNPHSSTFPNFPEYYISDLLAWHIVSGGSSVSYNGETYDEGGIVGFDPFGVSAMGDISTSLRVGPRYQSKKPDYGFGFMDFMTLMGIFGLLNNLRFMDGGGLLPYQRDPYLDPGAYGKARDNRYNRSARGKAGRISKAMYKDLSSFFGPIGDYLIPDFLNPFGEEASIQGLLKFVFYDMPLGIYNFATESVPNYFSNVFGIGGEKSRRAKASHEGFFGFGKGGVIPSLYMGGDKYGSLGSGKNEEYIDDYLFNFKSKNPKYKNKTFNFLDLFEGSQRADKKNYLRQAEYYSRPTKPFDSDMVKLAILGTTFPLAAWSFFSRRTRGSSGLSDYLNRDLEIGEEAPSDFDKILALGDKGPLDPVRALFYLAYGTALYSHLSDYPTFMKMKNPLYSRKSGGAIPSMRQGGGGFNIKDYLTPEMGLNMFLGGMFGGMLGTGLGVDPLTMMLLTLSGLGMGAYGGYRATNRQDLLGNPIGELFGKGGRISEAGLGGDFSKFMMATMLLTGGSHIYGALGGNKRAASIGKGIGFGALSAGYSYAMLDLAKDESQSDLGRAIALYFGLAPLIGPIGFTDSYPHFMPYEAIASGFRGEQFGKGGNIPSFGSGGSLQTMRSGPAIGPDHQSGMLGVTKQGAPFLFEGGEYIVSRAAASRIGSSNLDQINKGKIPDSMASGGSIPEKGLGAGLFGLVAMAPFMMEEINEGVASMGRGVNYFFENIGDFFMMLHPFSYMGSGGSLPSLKEGDSLMKAIKRSPKKAMNLLKRLEIESSVGKTPSVFDQDYANIGLGTAGALSTFASLMLLEDLFSNVGSKSSVSLGGLRKGKDRKLGPIEALALLAFAGGLGYVGTSAMRGSYTGKGFGSGMDDVNNFIGGFFGSGGVIPQASAGGLAASLLLAGYGTGFGDFLGGSGLFPGGSASRNNPMTAGRAGKGFGQFLGTLAGSAFLFSALQDKNPLSLLLGLGTIFGTNLAFADTPRGRSTNPFSFSDTQKYNRSMFASGGAIPSFDAGGLAYLFGGAGYAGGRISRNHDLGYGGAGGLGFGLGALGGIGLIATSGTNLSDTEKLQMILSFGLLNSLVGLGTYGLTNKNKSIFASGGAIPSFAGGSPITGSKNFNQRTLETFLLTGGLAYGLMGSSTLRKGAGLGVGTYLLGSALTGQNDIGGLGAIIGALFLSESMGLTDIFNIKGANNSLDSSIRDSFSNSRDDFGWLPNISFTGGMSGGLSFGSGGAIPSFGVGSKVDYTQAGVGLLMALLSRQGHIDTSKKNNTSGQALSFLGMMLGLDLFSSGLRGRMSNTQKGYYSIMDFLSYRSGGSIPSYKAGDFPIPDAFTMGSIGVGAGLGAFLGAVLGKDNEKLLPILMLTGILGGGFLGGNFGNMRRMGFDLDGSLLPRHGKIKSRVNYGLGGAIPSFDAGGSSLNTEDFLQVGLSGLMSVYGAINLQKGDLLSGVLGLVLGLPSLYESLGLTSNKRSGEFLFGSYGGPGSLFGSGGSIPSFGQGGTSVDPGALLLLSLLGGGLSMATSKRGGAKSFGYGAAGTAAGILGVAAMNRNFGYGSGALIPALAGLYAAFYGSDEFTPMGAGLLYAGLGAATQFGSGGSIPSFRKGGMTDQQKLMFSILAGLGTGIASYSSSTKSANILHSKPGDFGGALYDGLKAFLIAGLPISLLYGSGGSIPSFASGGMTPEEILLLSAVFGSAFVSQGNISASRAFKGAGAGMGTALMMAALGHNFGPMGTMAGILGLTGAMAYYGSSNSGKPFLGYRSGGSIPYFQAGGLAKGPSHESGMVGYSKSGGPFMFEGGEYIIRKSSVDKLGVGTLDALNSGMYSMGKGGVIPSFEEGTNMGGLPIEAGMYARRDLFGIKSSDDAEEVYVTNYSDMSGAGIYGASTVELLAGISLILQSMLISTYNEEGNYIQLSTIASEQLLVLEMFASNQFAIPDSMYKMTELMDENNKIVRDNEGNAVMVKTQELTEEGLEYQKTLVDAGIQPGKLLRIELSLLGPMAMSQFALLFSSIAPKGPSLDDQLFSLAVQGAVQYAGLTGTTTGALATLGIYHGRETAEEGKGDLAAAAGIIALTAISGTAAGPIVGAAAAIAAAEVIGKPEKYFAEIGMDEQMDLQEPVTGLYDELMNPNDGLLTYPQKYFEAVDDKIMNAGDRLLEGTDHMNMNSQKLGSAMERAFGLDEGSLQFDAFSGLEESYASIESLSKIGDRLKELEDIVAPNVQALIDGVKYIVEYPAEVLKKLGKSIKKLIGGSIGELFDVVLGFPLHLVDAIESSMKGMIGIGVQEFTKNILALFLGIALFPVTIMMLVTGKMGQTVDEFLTNLVIFTGAIALLPVTLTMAIIAANAEFVVKFAESFNNTVLGGILNIPGNLLKGFLDQAVPVFFGSFMGVFDSFLGEILMIPNMLLQETVNFVTALPGKLLKMFGIEFPFFELNALKNPFHGNLGGPEYLIDLEIGEKSKGDGGLINYGRGGVLQTGGLAVGPSHQSGMLGMTKAGTPFLFEGGEYIINKKTTDLLGADFMAGVNDVKSDSDLQNIFSMLSIFENGGELFNLGMNDNPLSRILKLYNPLSSIAGPNSFEITIDPKEDLSGFDFTQNIFENGGDLFGLAGSPFGNDFEKEIISAKNPFTQVISFIERFQQEVSRKNWLGKVIGSFLRWATRTVRRVVPLGPDKLKLGLKGDLLDVYNSRLTSNFGSDVLGKLGLGSLPTPTMAMGGLVHGPSHGNGGVVAEMEGGEYVINRNSASELGSSFLGGLNSGGANFASSLVTSSNMSNQLLNKLIQVVEDKDLSVNINNEPAEETPTEDIRLSVDRERAYRGSRMLA